MAKKQDFRNRFEKDFGGGNGNTVIFQLPLNSKILRGWVKLTGTLHLTDPGGGAKGADTGEGLASLIKRVIVRTSKAPGSRYPDGKVVDLSVRSILRKAIAYRGKYLKDVSATACDGSAGDYAINLLLPIWFANPNMKRQIECALNADETAYQNIQVEVQTGIITDCFTGNTMTADYSDLSLEWIDRREQADGDTYVLVQEDHLLDIPGPRERLVDLNLPTDGAFTNMLLMTQNAGALTEGVLKKVEISAANLDLRLKAADIRQNILDEDLADVSQALTGLYLLPFVSMDGMITNAIPAPGFAMSLDVLEPNPAANNVLVATDRVFAPVNPQWVTPDQRGRRTS